MKIISWNVNGLRAVLQKGFCEFVAASDADVICLQEVKAQPEQVAVDELIELGYETHWNSAEKKGYSGVLTLSKATPLSVSKGIARPQHDSEGRVITTEFADFFLVNCYTPNAQTNLTRLAYRQDWDREFLAFVQSLQEKKPTIICGDLNVAHQEIDLARPDQNHRSAGFTPEERAGMEALLAGGFFDTFRQFEPGPGHYTWWSYRGGARQRNVGWRIDYFLASLPLKQKITASGILPHVMGSDHCPVVLEIGP